MGRHVLPSAHPKLEPVESIIGPAHPLLVHVPALLAQQNVDALITEPRMRKRSLD